MRQVVEVLVQALVENPEQIVIKERFNGNEVTYELTVAQKEPLGA